MATAREPMMPYQRAPRLKPPISSNLLTEGQTHAMEVDEEGVVSPPASPVSHVDDELLTGGWCNWGRGRLGPPDCLVS